MKTEILIVGHKKIHKPLFKNEYKKIFVGPNQSSLASSQDYRDSVGANIAEKNANYNEMTAIYWAWKNLDLDNYGFCHYRRFLKYKGKLLDKKMTEGLLKTYDVIIPKPELINDKDKTNEGHYVNAVKHNDVETLRNIIIQKYPEFLEAYNLVMARKSGHMRNTFIMNKTAFESYSSFIFPLLSELEAIIPTDELVGPRSRAFGFLAEKLLDVWIEINHINFIEVDMIFSELGIQRYKNALTHRLQA